MGLDLVGRRRHLLGRPFEYHRVAVRRHEGYPRMRVYDGHAFQVFEYGLLPPHVLALDVHLEPRAVLLLPDDEILSDRLRPVLLRVHHEFALVGDVVIRYPRLDLGGLARGYLSVHHDSGDAYPLLPSPLRPSVESRAIEQPPEYVGDLLLDDARAVVLDGHLVLVVFLLIHLDEDVGEDTRVLAGVEAVVDRLLDGRDKRPCEGVEAEYVLVLLEELGDGYLLLLLRQFMSYRCQVFLPPQGSQKR